MERLNMRRHYHKLTSKLDDTAFTLIELIVVMAIIAILVLLAAPQFLGRTDEAKLTNIKHDTAVVEKDVNEGFGTNNSEYIFANWDSISQGVLEEAFESDNIYGKGGLLEEFDPTVDYTIVPDKVIDGVRSQLEGTFLTDKDGNVLYVADVIYGEPENEIGSELDQIREMLLTDVAMVYNWEPADMDGLGNSASNGLVYDENGEVTTIDPNDNYYVVPSDKVPSDREGTYYANDKGDVIYVYPSGNEEDIPGSTELVAGDDKGENGIYETIPSDGFFLNEVLPFPSSVKNRKPAAWMKLQYDGRTLFVPQKPIGTVQSPSSNDPIYTNTKFTHHGITYQVRLFTEEEWNNIMYPIHENASSLGYGVYEHGLGSAGNGQFTNDDLALGGNGTWVQSGSLRGASGDVTSSSSSGKEGVYRPIVEVAGVDYKETNGEYQFVKSYSTAFGNIGANRFWYTVNEKYALEGMNVVVEPWEELEILIVPRYIDSQIFNTWFNEDNLFGSSSYMHYRTADGTEKRSSQISRQSNVTKYSNVGDYGALGILVKPYTHGDRTGDYRMTVEFTGYELSFNSRLIGWTGYPRLDFDVYYRITD